ncbi:MAG: hypothetical protein JNG88_18000 [Phycisphaerales bacterium]|nr:hypothetical protein [Phycisphaerales bacterium]
MRRATVFILLVNLVTATSAWDAHGHRVITYLALDGLTADMPQFLRENAIRDQIAEQSNEPDRWRGCDVSCLHHENAPDHYLDVELLDQFGLTLDSVPPLRYEYLRALAIAKHEHPDRVDAYDASKDPHRTKEWPGMLPWAIAEHQSKLQSAFNSLRILEALNEPARAHQLAMARANVAYHMGVLSHFVGDAAQPLHTTKHFNGWVGPNPSGYTSAKSFHSYIDGDVIELHKLTYAMLKPAMKHDRRIAEGEEWSATLAHIRRGFERVDELYKLEKSGGLKSEPGKEFISERLRDGAETLTAYYRAAWEAAKPTSKQIADFKKYNNFNPVVLPRE